MDSEYIKALLKKVKHGEIEVDDAVLHLRKLPFEDLGYAKPDTHRNIRTGVTEVIFAQGKTIPQIQGIAQKLAEHHCNIMATRASAEVFHGVQAVLPDTVYHETARIVVVKPQPVLKTGKVAIVAAGTSDIPVAEEAAVTAETLGSQVIRLFDVGVSGLHRILKVQSELMDANVAVVVAGMEGALPSVVGGLVACPVIAVPTSIGYGASFGGVAALLGMLNSCAAGVSVVNIDNGFGAGFQANLINKQSYCEPNECEEDTAGSP